MCATDDGHLDSATNRRSILALYLPVPFPPASILLLFFSLPLESPVYAIRAAFLWESVNNRNRRCRLCHPRVPPRLNIKLFSIRARAVRANPRTSSRIFFPSSSIYEERRRYFVDFGMEDFVRFLWNESFL